MTESEIWIELRLKLIKLLSEGNDKVKINTIILQLKTIIENYE